MFEEPTHVYEARLSSVSLGLLSLSSILRDFPKPGEPDTALPKILQSLGNPGRSSHAARDGSNSPGSRLGSQLSTWAEA